jgi:NADH-quinone oxidoreductase subunit M
MMTRLVTWVIGLPRLGAGRMRLVPKEKATRGAPRALGVSRLTFLRSLLLWVGFDRSPAGYQGVSSLGWRPRVNAERRVGVDGISLLFVLLTTRLVPLCVLASWEAIGKREPLYYALFLLREGLVLIVFLSRDLLLFYVSFEAVLIPRFVIIGRWGSRERKVRAAYFFFLYTLLGSVFRLLALLLLAFEAGTRERELLRQTPLSEARQKVLWLAFFASFAVKVPRLPVHIWLPEAHVEAPTAGSVRLAGVLLKLGTYGLVRFSLPLFPVGRAYFTPLVRTRAVVAIVYTSLTAIRQGDRKRVIAYASVAHRNRTLVGVFSGTREGLEGGIFQRLAHGVVSGALFLCVGVLYDRHHSRRIAYYGGVAHTRPRYASLFLVFTRANIALPGTASFVGEFRILVGAFRANPLVAILSATGRVLGGAYSLWLFNRVAYGNLKTAYHGFSADLTRREARTFLPLVVLGILRGIRPQPFLDTREVSCANLLEQVRLRG